MSREGKYWENPEDVMSYDVREQLMADDEDLPQPETSITHKVIAVLFSIAVMGLVAYLIVSANSWATWLIIPIGLGLLFVTSPLIYLIALRPNRKI